MPRLLNLKQLCAYLQRSRVTIWRLVKKGELPQPARRIGRSPMWREEEIVKLQGQK